MCKKIIDHINIKIVFLGQDQFGGTDYVLRHTSNLLQEKGLSSEFLTAKDIDKKIECDILVIPTSNIKKIFNLANRIAYKKVLIWSLGETAFSAAFYNPLGRNIYDKLLKFSFGWLVKTFALHLIKNNSLIFSDENSLSSEMFGINFEEDLTQKIVYIPVDVEKNIKNAHLNNLKLAWVGRIDDDFKIEPLIKLVNDFDILIENGMLSKQATLTIIGSGNSEQYLLKSISILKNKDKIHCIGSISIEKLRNLLSDYGIVFAMGSSALHSASKGVPVVIVNPSHKKIVVESNYRWIYETIGGSLGEFFSIKSHPIQIKKTLKQILQGYNAEECQRRTIDFVKKFDSRQVVEKFLSLTLPVRPTLILKIFFFASYMLWRFKAQAKKIIRKA